VTTYPIQCENLLVHSFSPKSVNVRCLVYTELNLRKLNILEYTLV